MIGLSSKVMETEQDVESVGIQKAPLSAELIARMAQ